MSIVHCHAVKYSKVLTRDESGDGFKYWSTLLPTKFWTNSETFRSNHNHQQQQHYPSTTSSEMETVLDKFISSNDSEPLQDFGGKPLKKKPGTLFHNHHILLR